MLKIILFLLFIVVGLFISPSLSGVNGVLTITIADYLITTNIVAFILLALLFVLIVNFVYYFFKNLLTIGSSTKSWFSRHQRRRAREHYQQAILNYFEGDYLQAEKRFITSSKYADKPLINYLFAVRCAWRHHDITQANRYLEQVQSDQKTDQLAVTITRLHLQLEQGSNYEAAAIIEPCLKEYPHHPEILRLAAIIYQATNAYQPLLDLLPMLSKFSILPKRKLTQLQVQAYIGILQTTPKLHTVEQLKAWWRNLPRDLRNNHQIAAAAAQQFIKSCDDESAFNIIAHALQQHNDKVLIQLLPELDNAYNDSACQLLVKLLDKYGSQPILLSVLAQLYMKQGDWNKANELLQQSVQQHEDLQSYLLLAESYQKLDLPEQANQVKNKALSFMLDKDHHDVLATALDYPK